MAIVVDAHSDILSDLLGRRAAGQTGILNGTWIPAMDAAGIDVRVLAIYSGVAYLPELALRREAETRAVVEPEALEALRAEALKRKAPPRRTDAPALHVLVRAPAQLDAGGRAVDLPGLIRS